MGQAQSSGKTEGQKVVHTYSTKSCANCDDIIEMKRLNIDETMTYQYYRDEKLDVQLGCSEGECSCKNHGGGEKVFSVNSLNK